MKFPKPSHLHFQAMSLLLSVSWVQGGGQCPGAASVCSCLWRSGGKFAMVCDSQNLKTIPENIVSDDHEVVTSASFANNSIELTESLELLNFQHLQELILKENVIEELPRGFFREMQALRKLDLSHNRLTSISNGDFNLLVNLRHLDLSHNHLTNVADEAFIHLVKLESLDLSSNKLYSLAIEDLAAAGADGDLLGVDSRRTLTRLKTLRLAANPWRCDCALGRLAWALRTRRLDPGPAVCGPDRRGWKGLPPSNFTCRPALVTVTPPQNVLRGDNISIECKFEANPTPHVYWRFDGMEVDASAYNSDIKESVLSVHQVKSKLKLYDISPESSGLYTCHAINFEGEGHATVPVTLAAALGWPGPAGADLPVGLVAGLSVGVAALLGLGLGLGWWKCRRRSRSKQVREAAGSSSLHNTSVSSTFALLSSASVLPPMVRAAESEHGPASHPTNPVPKPPRTGVYSNLGRRSSLALPPGVRSQDSLLAPHYGDSLECPELLRWLSHRPGSRASVGTASTLLSSHHEAAAQLQHPAPPPPLARHQTHPPHQPAARPGYVTLPRKPRSRPLTPAPSVCLPLELLGPRTSADGSSFHNIASMVSPTHPADHRLVLPHMQFSTAAATVVTHNNNNNIVSSSKVGEEASEHSEEVEEDTAATSRPALDTILEQE